MYNYGVLKKRNRLTTKEFGEVFSRGRSVFSENFMCKVADGFCDEFKISVAVGKKVQKGAVGRVKTRRVVYRFCKKIEGEIKRGVGVVILVKNDILSVDSGALEKELGKILKRGGVCDGYICKKK